MTVLQQEFLFDRRIVSRNVAHGRIKREAYENHLDKLQDLSDKCEDIGTAIFAGEHKAALTQEKISDAVNEEE